MQLLVFSRKGEETVHVTENWEVTCGIGNVIQNKGSLGVVVVPRGAGAPPITFMTAHLAAHASKVSARNKDYQRITEQIKFNNDLILNIPIEDRVKIFEFDYDANYVNALKLKVEKAREYYETIKL